MPLSREPYTCFTQRKRRLNALYISPIWKTTPAKFIINCLAVGPHSSSKHPAHRKTS